MIPEVVITEDSNSGYQFFEQICIENGLKCESMNGKSNVFHYKLLVFLFSGLFFFHSPFFRTFITI